MNVLLLSLKEVAQVMEKSTHAVKLAVQRGKFSTVRYLTKQEALSLGLKWRTNGGSGRSNKRPFIPITDPAIPSSVRLKYRELHSLSVSSNGSFQQTGKAPEAMPLGPSAHCPALNPLGVDTKTVITSSSSAPGVLPANSHINPELTEDDVYRQLYLRAPAYNRRKADKYETILDTMAGLEGRELRQAISEWNQGHPDFHTSYVRVTQMRKALKEHGKQTLLGNYGKPRQSKIRPEWYEAFKSRYLKEGAPSLRSCWLGALGEARRLDPSVTVADFPSAASFEREIRRRVPPQGICFHRQGEKAWNQRHGGYIERDYSGLLPGEVYVSDHAQVDVAVRAPSGKIVFPWVTAISDMRSDKYLGWTVYPDNPNSDRIFQASFRAFSTYGVPTEFYIDNGKDYRCFDFAGGRKTARTVKADIDEVRTTSLLLKLDVQKCHFAIPYNARAKTIERTFLRNKEWFSKQMPGYRGGNIKERPDILKAEVKDGKTLLEWTAFEKLMDDFFVRIANRMPSNGKKLKGMCPDELFEKNRRPPIVVKEESLMILCMRSSRPQTIGRNGIKVTIEGGEAWYWAEWMEACKGQKAYMRRDTNTAAKALVFSADGKETCLGWAELKCSVPAIARTEEERTLIAQEMERQRRGRKFAKESAGPIERRPAETLISDLSDATTLVNGHRGYTPSQDRPKVIEVKGTVFDNVPGELERQEKIGTQDLSPYVSPRPQQKKISVWMSDLPKEDREMRLAAYRLAGELNKEADV